MNEKSNSKNTFLGYVFYVLEFQIELCIKRCYVMAHFRKKFNLSIGVVLKILAVKEIKFLTFLIIKLSNFMRT